ncbi:MAG: hypothetical protein HYT70_03955 [Candidatus Aenigmarchaeota archaeon]|nr:hypothetical protein [Candidatus Aenigmarchaeota archaeon]
MGIEFIFGLAILGVVFYVLFKVLGNIALGALLVLLIFISSYLILGSFPEVGNVPVLGRFIPKTGQIIAAIKDFQYSIDVLGTSTSSNGNLLVAVLNSGQSDLSNFTAYVDGRPVVILNGDLTLKSGSVVVLELDWKGEAESVLINAGDASDTYKIV